MSSTVIDRARPAGHRAPHRGSGFTGTLGLLRLYLRRDRVSLPLWVLLLSVPLATVYIASVETVYPDRSARAAAAAAIMASPAQRRSTGRSTTTAWVRSESGKPGCFTPSSRWRSSSR
ncbi:putative exporter of polyketide antibiotics [Mycobacterium tuberculosis]|nr:putative exporter of polyketide antibiotics [Mycobacterium tuberculosis]